MYPIEAARQGATTFAATAVHRLTEQLLVDDGLGICGHLPVTWRIKSVESIKRKTARGRAINDLVGIRVLALHQGYLPQVLGRLAAWADEFDLQEGCLEDGLSERDPSGYRAVHVDYSFRHAADWQIPAGAGIEIQVSTWLLHYHGSLAHRLYHKADPDASQPWMPFLKRLSQQLWDLDCASAEDVGIQIGINQLPNA